MPIHVHPGVLQWSAVCVAARCSALQHIAVCRSVLQCVAVCPSDSEFVCILQCVAVCWSVFGVSLECVAVCCSMLQCVWSVFAVCCSVLQYVTVCLECVRSVLQCVALCCSVFAVCLQCAAVWCKFVCILRWHIWERVLTHVGMSHGTCCDADSCASWGDTYRNESRHTLDWVMAHVATRTRVHLGVTRIEMSHDTRRNESWHMLRRGLVCILGWHV